MSASETAVQRHTACVKTNATFLLLHNLYMLHQSPLSGSHNPFLQYANKGWRETCLDPKAIGAELRQSKHVEFIRLQCIRFIKLELAQDKAAKQSSSLMSTQSNILISSSALSGAESLRGHAPGRLADTSLPLAPASSMRVVHRIHGHTPHNRPPP